MTLVGEPAPTGADSAHASEPPTPRARRIGAVLPERLRGQRERISRTALLLTFELVVTFVGLLLAFAVENYREARNRSDRARQVYAALGREVQSFATVAPILADTLQRAIAAFDSARARGERPAPPVYYVRAGSERIPTDVWDATRAAGGLELVEPRLFFTLAEFYNRVNSISDRYRRYVEYTEHEVLHRLSTPAAFYDATGALRPEYATYVDRLRDVHTLLVARVPDARQLAARLDSARARMR
ncbi:MAG: hypothetical protein ACXW61_04995 [Gemmatirosa sp.]